MAIWFWVSALYGFCSINIGHYIVKGKMSMHAKNKIPIFAIFSDPLSFWLWYENPPSLRYFFAALMPNWNLWTFFSAMYPTVLQYVQHSRCYIPKGFTVLYVFCGNRSLKRDKTSNSCCSATFYVRFVLNFLVHIIFFSKCCTNRLENRQSRVVWYFGTYRYSICKFWTGPEAKSFILPPSMQQWKQIDFQTFSNSDTETCYFSAWKSFLSFLRGGRPRNSSQNMSPYCIPYWLLKYCTFCYTVHTYQSRIHAALWKSSPFMPNMIFWVVERERKRNQIFVLFINNAGFSPSRPNKRTHFATLTHVWRIMKTSYALWIQYRVVSAQF